MRYMFDTIIKALGGYTESEYKILDSTCEAWRGRCVASETTVELVKEILTRERERSQRLEERLFPNSKPQQQQPPNMEPVGQSVSSWPRIKRELEKEHRVKDAQISREEIEKAIRGKE